MKETILVKFGPEKGKLKQFSLEGYNPGPADFFGAIGLETYDLNDWELTLHRKDEDPAQIDESTTFEDGDIIIGWRIPPYLLVTAPDLAKLTDQVCNLDKRYAPQGGILKDGDQYIQALTLRRTE